MNTNSSLKLKFESRETAQQVKTPSNLSLIARIHLVERKRQCLKVVSLTPQECHGTCDPTSQINILDSAPLPSTVISV